MKKVFIDGLKRPAPTAQQYRDFFERLKIGVERDILFQVYGGAFYWMPNDSPNDSP